MTITIRMREDEANLIRSYAKAQNRAISDVIRAFTLEKIEDEIDLNAYIQAMAEHEKNPQVASLDEVWKQING